MDVGADPAVDGGGRAACRRTGEIDHQVYERAAPLFVVFSSRRRHTRLQGDWSSDVCSSDLWALAQLFAPSATRPSFRPTGEISLPGSLPCLSCRAQRSISFSPHTSPTFNVFVLRDVDGLHESLRQVGDGAGGSGLYLAADHGGGGGRHGGARGAGGGAVAGGKR